MTGPDKIELKITENDSDPIISTCTYNIPVDEAENLRIKADDINSADDVRQEIKLLLKDNIYKSTSKENVTITNKTLLHKDLKISGGSKTVSIICNLPEDCNQITLASNTLKLVSGAGDSVKLRKRPGRPPKAGPSKKQRLQRSSLFYVGKLCNVRRGYDSDYTNSD